MSFEHYLASLRVEFLNDASTRRLCLADLPGYVDLPWSFQYW